MSSTQKLDIDDGTAVVKRPSKIPLIVAGIFIIATIALAIALGVVVSQNSEKSESDDASNSAASTTSDDICVTPGCARAAGLVLEAMDQSVDPCDDFYMMSCGNWIKKNIIPEDKSSYSTFTKMRDEVTVQLKALLEEENQPSDPQAITETRDLYKACMDLESIEARGVQPMRDLLAKLGGWPIIDSTWDESSFDLINLLTEMRLLNNRYLVDLWVSADDKNSSSNILQLDQFTLGLPGRDYFLEPSYAKYVEGYKVYMKDVALYMGGNSSTIEQDAEDVIEFETYLANITMRQEDRRDSEALYNKLKIQDLSTNITNKFEWSRYINKVFESVNYTFQDDTEVVVYAPGYLRQMAEKLETTPKRVQANYIIWRLVSNRVAQLPEGIKDLRKKYSKVLSGVSSDPPRWFTCATYVNTFTGMAVGRLFVNKYFNEGAKASALGMIAGVREAFDNLLEDVEWMNEQTRETAKTKSAAISEKIGYPDWINNDTRLNELYDGLLGYVDTTKYFENYLASIRYEALHKLKDIHKPVDRQKWSTTPAIVNAYYSSSKNQITFPAGILQPPFWQEDRPMAMNYGGIGMVIGHEITHGFDDRGRQFDGEGNLVQWWDQDVIDNFKEKAECIVNQYGSYVVPQINRTLNGINTQGENIADNGGIKQAYQAMLKWEAENGEGQRLPGLKQFSSKHLFFIAFSQVWCSAYRDQAMTSALATGVHSPGMYRVIGTLSNFPEFAEVFQCKPGSRMNPTNRCSVW